MDPVTQLAQFILATHNVLNQPTHICQVKMGESRTKDNGKMSEEERQIQRLEWSKSSHSIMSVSPCHCHSAAFKRQRQQRRVRKKPLLCIRYLNMTKLTHCHCSYTLIFPPSLHQSFKGERQSGERERRAGVRDGQLKMWFVTLNQYWVENHWYYTAKVKRNGRHL